MARNDLFDRLAHVYNRAASPPDADMLQRVMALPAPGWVLDAAGGTGRAVPVLCSLVERLAVCDLSRPMLAQAAGKQPPGRGACFLLSQAKVERLPYADGQFSRILVMDAFHHFDDQTGSLRELARVLAPGGRLVIADPDIRRFAVKLIALIERLALMGSVFHTPDAMQGMVRAVGLDASVHMDGPMAWVIATKPI